MSSRKEEIPVWKEETVALCQDRLLSWYDREKRLLPWRENTDPYRVWVSEIMLQQTQVVTVIPYFHRFMEWFPTITDLAEADEDRLLKAWEGLGYYSRVRNMQVAAKEMVANYDGQMPDTIDAILSLKGIGPYTGGAVSSIAFERPEPAVDGNVMRVYSRLFCISDDIAVPKTRKVFEKKVRETISHERPGDFNQALMDLGSGICTPTSPKCDECPLMEICGAYQAQTMTEYPVKTKKVKAVPLYYVGLAIQNQSGAYLLEQRPKDGLLANLWTFPLLEVDKATHDAVMTEFKLYQAETDTPTLFDFVAEENQTFETGTLVQTLNEAAPYAVWQTQPVGDVTHLFSHRKWHMVLGYGRMREGYNENISENQSWVMPEDFDSYAFPKPQQKMVDLLKKRMNK